jgi:sulfonate transport system substrate-binding protein
MKKIYQKLRSKAPISILSALVLSVVLLGGCKTAATTANQESGKGDTTATTEAAQATGNDTKAETSEKTDTTKTESSFEGVTLRVGETGWGSYEELLKAAGLDDTEYNVEYYIFQGGNLCLEAMAADKIDFTGTSEIPPIAASLADNGGNFKIVGVNNSSPQNQELVVLESSGIKSVADLKGKKVGYIKNTTAQYFLYQMLVEAGLSWNDIDAIEITTADGVTALTSGNIDAFASYGNSINAAKNSGAATLASAIDILSGNFPFEVSDKALADEQLSLAAADYLARIQKAYEWEAQHIEDWAKIQAEPTGQTYEEALDLLQKTYADRGSQVLTIDDEIIQSEQSVADTFYDLGLFETKIDANQLYDTTFSEKYNSALEKLK